MERFYILEVVNEIPEFREVEGEPVVVGGVIQAFKAYSRNGEFPTIFDTETGRRVSTYEDTHEEAKKTAEKWLKDVGLLKWRDAQMASLVNYGTPPYPDIEVIRHSVEPDAGDLNTCVRER